MRAISSNRPQNPQADFSENHAVYVRLDCHMLYVTTAVLSNFYDGPSARYLLV